MFELGNLLKDGLKQTAKDSRQNLLVQGPGPMIHMGFTSHTEVNDYRDTFTYDKGKLGRFIAAMHNKGIRIIGRGLWYISAVHTKEDIEQAIKAATEVLQEL